MSEITDEQMIKARSFETRAFAAINDGPKFDAVMAEFDEWKKSEGIDL